MTEQYEKMAKELANALNQFSKNVNKILKEMFSFEGKKEKDWKMKCPYEYGDKHYCIQSSGDVFLDSWKDIEADNSFFSQGNIFPTKQAALLEAERRNLLTRFRAFRDECNGDLEPDWNNNNSKKWCIVKNEEGMYAMWTFEFNSFSYFGYFKNQEDAERAIELFGDEIKALFVDSEV